MEKIYLVLDENGKGSGILTTSGTFITSNIPNENKIDITDFSPELIAQIREHPENFDRSVGTA